MKELDTFRKQIVEDLDFFKREYVRYSEKLEKPEYAFNFWILTELFQIEAEVANDYIVEYNDGGLDCYVHYEENKELYLIQNKYYSKNTHINRDNVSDFLTNPLVQLGNQTYTRSRELQNIFIDASNDSDYKIFLLFITTSENTLPDQTASLFKTFNRETQTKFKCGIYSEFIDFYSLYKKYYGVEYVKTSNFQFDLQTYQGKGYAAVLEDYQLNLPYETYYIITPIKQIYDLYVKAENESYRLFDQNIRDFLGENPINNAIIKTLKDPDTRQYFLYYNNGITINCDNRIKTELGNRVKTRVLKLSNPKVVNGCQTVNSIKLAMDAVPSSEREEAFKSAYVLVKILIITSQSTEDVVFYKNVVKYTNKQNSIPEKSFILAEKKEFEKIKEGLKSRGVLTAVKASDKNTYRNYPNSDKTDILARANNNSAEFGNIYQKFSDVIIEFEKLLQILVAFFESPQIAIQKKSYLLKESSEWYEKYSSQIQKFFTIDNWVNLISYFKVAGTFSKNTENPISPFYMIGFLGYVIRKNIPITEEVIPATQKYIQHLFRNQEATELIISSIEKLCTLYSMKYYEQHGTDYNRMIKSSINEEYLKSVYDSYNVVASHPIPQLFND